jgi:exopolysaccharide biosynthesis polyprenyl glycosylphosphotransferase
MSKQIQLAFKRFLDIVLCLIGLVLLIIPFALIALAIKLDSRGPVFFKQARIGQNGKRFACWKFRTMVKDAENHPLGAFTTTGDPRITRLGQWLRRSGLDELPQLFNVLKGEMSLIGPRPTLAYQVAKYNQEQRQRLLVKPGITSWALVNGRNQLTWPEKIELDLWYVRNWSLGLDFKILFKTPFVILKGEGLFLEKQDEILKQEAAAATDLPGKPRA